MWTAFTTKWPERTGYYYVCWNFRRIRIRKIAVDYSAYYAVLNFCETKDHNEDHLAGSPTHWMPL